MVDTLDPEKMVLGGTFTLQKDLRLRIAGVQDGEGKLWIPLYTSEAEAGKAASTGVQMNMRIADLLQNGLCSDEAAGIVINPFSESLMLDHKILEAVWKTYMECRAEKTK